MILVSAIIAGVCLLAASLTDIRTREVPDLISYGMSALGLGIAVRQRALRATFDIEIKVNRNVRATRPLWIWQALAVAEKIPLDHRVWFDLQHDVPDSAQC